MDALFPEQDGIALDYRGYGGQPVRTHFRFDDAGKLRLTDQCADQGDCLGL
jgi:hypothetical protein